MVEMNCWDFVGYLEWQKWVINSSWNKCKLGMAWNFIDSCRRQLNFKIQRLTKLIISQGRDTDEKSETDRQG